MKSRIEKFIGRSFAIAAISGLTLMGFPALAAAEQPVNTLSIEDRSHLQEFFSEYGVEVGTQESLIAQFEAGEVWDSMSEGAEPITIEESSNEASDLTVATYADGSIAVTSVEKPSDSGTLTRSNWGCTFVSAAPYGGYWKNCYVNVNLGIIMQGFTLDYQNIAVAGGNKITGYRYHDYWIVGGALTNHRIQAINAKQVRYSADLSLAWQGFPVGWVSWMQANLNGNLITTTHN